VLVLLMDALLVFPFLLLAIVIAFLLSDKVGQGILTAAIAITVVYIPLYFRVVRNHTISVREEPFVEAARALGARPITIIRKYVFFNVVQNVPPLATLNAADAILTVPAEAEAGQIERVDDLRIRLPDVERGDPGLIRAAVALEQAVHPAAHLRLQRSELAERLPTNQCRHGRPP
jgi:hypothetical protein